MFRIESFCYGIPLKSASVIYAAYFFTTSLAYPLIAFFGTVFSDSMRDSLCLRQSSIEEKFQVSETDLKMIRNGFHAAGFCNKDFLLNSMVLLISFIPLIIYSALLFAIIKEKPQIIRFYFYLNIVLMSIFTAFILLLGLILTVAAHFYFIFITLLVFGMFIPIPGYFLITLYSLACEYEEKEKRRGEYVEVMGMQVRP